MTEFKTLPLPPPLLQALDTLKYFEMTPVQAAALPPLLAGRDLIAQAPTGSGKTVAFGIGLLQRIDPTLIRAQALVLCPTRELADQVGKELRRLAAFIPNLKLLLLSGGVSLRPQLASLEQHDPHVVVGTPGRVQELMRKKVLHLGGVRTLVLDEADRMLDMGFEEAIREIAGRTPPERQTLLFSATFPDPIRAIARALLRDAAEVTVAEAETSGTLDQHSFEVDLAAKPSALTRLLLHYAPESCVVFCNTRRDVDDVATALQASGFSALPLHGEMEQRDRDETLLRFANRSCSVLVASDVAARGLDIEDLAAVVSYELPTDPDVHLHRTGRTARAGRNGLALNLATPREVPRALAIEKLIGSRLRWEKLPAVVGGKSAPTPAMVTLRLDAGRSEKMRPGDILGALTGDAGLPAAAVGKIDVFATRSYVAIRRAEAGQALTRLRTGKVKGRSVRITRL
jgi:ATP-independent RNA helicase DbpA